MPKAYQCDASGYFAGAVEDCGLLPNNATYTAPPEQQTGYVLRWGGQSWTQEEDHKGEQGYLDGVPYTIKDYGPCPEGWSKTPPPPTPEELATARMAAIDAEIRELEQKAMRPMLAIDMGLDDPYDHERRKEIMKAIIDLRCERQMLEAVVEQL